MDASLAEKLASIRERYETRASRFSREADALDAKGQRIGNYRGLFFLAAVGCLIAYGSLGSPLFVLGLAASLVAFIALVKHHSSVVEAEEQKRRFALVNEHGSLRVTNRWQTLPRAGTNFAPVDHAYCGDLDVFGNASLYQRISVAQTRYGQQTLAGWLSTPASEAEIALRQEAVLELSEDREFRENLEATSMALVDKGKGSASRLLTDGPNPSRLLNWAKTRDPILENPFVVALAFMLPTLSVFAMISQLVWGTPPYYWFATVAASMVLLFVTKTKTSEAFAAVSTTEGAFLRYGELLRIVETHQAKAEWFSSRRTALQGPEGQQPSLIMDRFRRIVSWYDFRHNGMAYPFFNAVLLWDIHCSVALSRWKAKSGAKLGDWFDIIGQYEAMASLAGLLADDPEASLPRIVAADELREEALSISASQMGHPLLACGKRVSNDLEPLCVGNALLVTGSNMSGKSTFLRALGANCILAFAGGPVIARSMQLPILQLGTSIRVSDSLDQGVSHFYAEVKKLALVVELARREERPVLFLLDEVLHGTNSRERQVGARWVLAELLKLGAFGVITTHDMELCRLPDELMKHVRQHHFRELVKDGEMTFDYTLRQGPVTSGNALRLMQKVGLDVPLD